MSTFPSPFAVIATAMLALSTLALPGPRCLAEPLPRQSEAELRATNEALRTRLADLELEIKAARARLAELERQLADANARLAALGGGGAGSGTGGVGLPARVEPVGTIDESTASASPRALLRALQGEYASALGPVGGWGTPRERTIYFRALEKWILAANRAHRAPVVWTIRLLDVAAVVDKRTELRVVALDPGSGVELGDPFIVVAQPSLARRLEAGGLLQPGTTLELRGTLIPDVKLNVDRETIGAFDQPRFIGPFAEFGFTVDSQSLTALRAELPGPPTAPPASAPGVPGSRPPAAGPPGARPPGTAPPPPNAPVGP